MGRLLTIHPGASKTGSSALQAFFQANAPRLAEAGVAYPHGRPLASLHEITSGNGGPLLEATRSGSDEALARAILSYLGDGEAGLCSSELLESLGPEEWARLVGAAEAQGVAVRVVVFVRHILPLLRSVHDQGIKRSGVQRPIGEWIRRHRIDLFRLLRALDGLRARVDLRVRSYDAARADIVGAFLEAAGIDLPRGEAVVEVGQVNRSLTAVEREVLLLLNQNCGKRFSRELSDLLIDAAPEARGEPSDDPSLRGHLARQYGADLAWANAAFFDGREVLRLEAPGAAPTPAAAGPAPQPEDARGRALGWALAKLGAIYGSDRADRPLIEYLREVADQPPAADPRLPPDFDPLRYLLRYSDVLTARLDPGEHYLAYGLREGRTYG